MAKYIEREAAIIPSFRYQLPNGEMSPPVVFVKTLLHSIPAADVRPVVRGEWRKIGKTGCIFVCSACDKTFPYKTGFCPNCGADMREES